MTRKDYELIAETLRIAYATKLGATAEYYEAQCKLFAQVLRNNNAAFDRARFLKACGL